MRLSYAVMIALTVTALGGVSFAQTPAGRPPVPGAPAGVTAFVDVGVIPMDTERTLEHQTVVIRDGRIAALGPAATTPIPPGAVRIDGRSRYLLPGLGACHGHVSMSGAIQYVFPPRDPRYAEFWLFQGYLARGVTVVRNVDYIDADQFPAFEVQATQHTNRDRLWLRAEAAAGRLWSPRLYTAGQWAPNQYIGADRGSSNSFFGIPYPESMPPPSSWPAPRMDSVAAYVAAFKAAGFDFIKFHNESVEVAESVFAAARRIGLPVGGHLVTSLSQALAGGQQVEDHAHGGAGDAGMRRRAGMWNCDIAKDGNEFIRALGDSGAGILLGADGPAQDPAFFIDGDKGLTPYQALATGTKNFGQYLRTLDPRGDETGTISVGQRADLVLLRGNPLQNIRYVSEILARPPELVMIGGRWLRGPDLRRRVATMATYETLRREWTNLRHDILGDSSFTTVERQAVVHLDSVYQEQQFVVAERFVLSKTAPAGGADSLRGPQTLVTLFAQQLGGLRTVLPPAARERFDAAARAWLATRVREGHRVTMTGVQRRARCGPTLSALEYPRSWPKTPKSLYGAALDRRPCVAPSRTR